jgi:hypothetical protein
LDYCLIECFLDEVRLEHDRSHVFEFAGFHGLYLA